MPDLCRLLVFMHLQFFMTVSIFGRPCVILVASMSYLGCALATLMKFYTDGRKWALGQRTLTAFLLFERSSMIAVCWICLLMVVLTRGPITEMGKLW